MLSSNNLEISTVRPAVFLLFNYYKALCTVPTSVVVRTISVTVYMSVLLNLFLLLWYYQKCLMPYQLRNKLNMYTKYLIPITYHCSTQNVLKSIIEFYLVIEVNHLFFKYFYINKELLKVIKKLALHTF